MTDSRAFLEQWKRELVDKGQLIEAGWVSLRIIAIPLDAPPAQLNDMRTAFFAGAQHLFSSIMMVLEPGAEPSEKDLKRMDSIDNELGSFAEVFEARYTKTEGNA